MVRFEGLISPKRRGDREERNFRLTYPTEGKCLSHVLSFFWSSTVSLLEAIVLLDSYAPDRAYQRVFAPARVESGKALGS